MYLREECISYEPILLLSSLIVFNQRCTLNVCFTPVFVHSGAVFDINRVLLFSAQPSAADILRVQTAVFLPLHKSSADVCA